MKPPVGEPQGVKLTFFSVSHLAPKYFKVVANSKKLVVIMTNTQTIFTLSMCQIPYYRKLGMHVINANLIFMWGPMLPEHQGQNNNPQSQV